MGLPCLNCRAIVGPEHGKLFGGVYCCPRCHELATRLYERGERELKALLLFQHEAIRIALTEGRLHFGPGEVDALSKADLLSEIGKLAQQTRRVPDSGGK